MKHSMFLSAMFLSLLLSAFLVQAQEPVTGGSSPTIVIRPADDSLVVLESQAEMAEFRESAAQADYDRILSNPPRTAAGRAAYMGRIKAARRELFIAKAESHAAKAKWCQYYAVLVNDGTKARLSAYKHRQLAGKWEQRALSMVDHVRPEIEHSGRHPLDLSRYGD